MMTILQHLVRDRLSILDGWGLMSASYLLFSGSIGKAFLVVLLTSIASGVLTVVVRATAGSRK